MITQSTSALQPIQPNLQTQQTRRSPAFWPMLLLTGVTAGLAGGLLMRLLRAVEHWAFQYSGATGFLDGVTHSSPGRRVLVLLAAGCLAGVAGYLTSRMAGDTDLSGAVWTRQGRLPMAKSSLRALYSIVVVGMGAAVGRENALKQAGGVLANLFAGWRNLPDEERRLLVACGGGAGMAAAYNVPLGGALFAAEVLLGQLSLQTLMPAFAASLLATAASWLLLPDKPTYSVFPSAVTPSLLVWAVLAGPLCGLLTVPFIRLLGWAKTHKPRGWQVLLLPVLALAALGLTATRLPAMLGNGKDVIALTLLNSPSSAMLLLLLLLRPLATASILRSGVPGGLFTPAMSFGALAGLLLGRAWGALLPQTAVAGQMPTCALVGSAAVLAAATQGPLSSVVFALELTRTADATMVPILLAVVCATVVTRHFETRSIYSIEVAQTAG